MAKRSRVSDPTALRLQTGVFRHVLATKHRPLFLPKLLAAEAKKIHADDKIGKVAFDGIQHWARLIESGALKQKETALDADKFAGRTAVGKLKRRTRRASGGGLTPHEDSRDLAGLGERIELMLRASGR